MPNKSPSRSIVWLASYPKSGNTWTRAFLANYLLNRQTPMPINEIHRLGMGDSSANAYAMVARGPFDPADPKQSIALRDRVLKGIVANKADVNFVKTHNIRRSAMGVELIPAKFTRAAVYILRNPLAIVPSFARHYSLTMEETVMALNREDHVVYGSQGGVTQFLGTWSEHVLSWTRARDFPLLVLRYEDLKRDPEAGFSKLLELIGVNVDPARLARAIRFSSFKELSKQEEKSGFIEGSESPAKFFHSGKVDQWREVLSDDLVEKIRRDHRRVLIEFGYL